MKISKTNLIQKFFTLLVLLVYSNFAFSQTTVNLASHNPLTTPAGTTFEWHSALPISSSNLLSAALIAVAPAGTYYGAFSDGNLISPCYSPAVKADVVTNICPALTADISTLAPIAASGAVMEWHTTSSPSSTDLVSDATSVLAGTYMAFNNVSGIYTNANETAIVTIIPTLSAPTSGGDQIVCQTLPIQTLIATASGNTITWYDAAIGGNIVASPTLSTLGSKTYYAQNSDPNYCPSTLRTAVVLTINAAPVPPTSGGDQIVCSDGTTTQTLTALATGGTITWYDAVTAGNIVATPTQVGVGTKTLYAQSSNGTCSSNSRTAVVLTINAAPVPPTSGGDQIVCSDGTTTQTLTALATGGTITWYDAVTAGNIVTTPTQVGVGTKTLYAQSSNGICSSTSRTAVVLTINAAPLPPVLIASSVSNICPVTTANLNSVHTETTPVNSTLVWYTTATPSSLDVAYTTPTTANAGTFYAFYLNSIHGCLSLASTPVTVSISECCAAGYVVPILH